MTPSSSFPPGLRRGAAALVLALAATAAAAAPLDDLRRFVEAGQFEQAYAAAMANRSLIGDVHFDFLYGVAAINVGKVPEGLLALERHLAAVPANDRARLELARGYFLVGEYARARSEFEFVLRYNPPAGVRATIARFLDAMQLRDTTERRGAARLYAELGAGRDSNVNLGTFRDEVLVGSTLINLSGSPSQGRSDDFGHAAIGGQAVYRVTSRVQVFAGVDVDHKENRKLTDFNLTNAAGSLGFSNLTTSALYRVSLGSQVLMVGNSRYRDQLALNVEAGFTPSPQWQTMLFGQYAELRHVGLEDVRDARQATVGAMATRTFAGGASLGVRISHTQEDNQRSRSDLDRSSPLVRVFGAFSPFESWRVSAGLTAYRQTFGFDRALAGKREDSAANVDLVLSWAFAPGWSVRAEYLAQVNRSNQDLYDSKRQSATLKTRYQY
jgi:tetratricopeptide (TPR) repeat protein